MIHSFSCAGASPRAMAALLLVMTLIAASPTLAGSVTDCGDAPDATTTLRGVVANAADNDYVDVSQCATITLQQGAISTALNLHIVGPSDGLTTIDAGMNSRAFVDTGSTSTLVLDHLLVEHGRAPGATDPTGGCVSGTYHVIVQNSRLSDCAATSNDGIARGGAVNAPNVSVTSSVMEGSLASSANANAQGGAVYAAAQFVCTNSLLQGNTVLSGGIMSGPSGFGGGAYSNSVSLNNCAVAGNHASHNGGGVWGFNVFVLNSTLSGNSADYFVGGVTAASFLAVSNSTIAFNQGGTCGGLFAGSSGSINSSILANNSATTATACHDVNAGFGAGTNNIVGVADAGVTLPPDTHVGDPELTPLGNHGGPTPTHALAPTSYAVDHGNNANALGTDQRGNGYDRVVNGSADIGAYERQLVDDEIFYSGLE